MFMVAVAGGGDLDCWGQTMRSVFVLVLTVPTLCLLGGEALAGRPHRDWSDRVRKEIRREIDSRAPVNPGDAEKEIEWLFDFDEASALAGREKRGLLVLFTTDELWRNSPYCNFRANRVRKAVRESNAVPLRLMPPVKLDLMGLPPDEAKKRREFYDKTLDKYAALAKRYGVSEGPALVLAAPDAKGLQSLVTPVDDQIVAGLGRLDEMIAAHQKAAGDKPPEARPPAGNPKPPAGDAPKADPKPDPKADPKPPANPDDDF
jgi:hypothetical protein